MEKEKDSGYPFDRDSQLEALPDELKVQELFDQLEMKIADLPKAYGRSFRYILHRDLRDLLWYHKVAQKYIPPPSFDSRFIATHAEP